MKIMIRIGYKKGRNSGKISQIQTSGSITQMQILFTDKDWSNYKQKKNEIEK